MDEGVIIEAGWLLNNCESVSSTYKKQLQLFKTEIKFGNAIETVD